MVGAAEWLVQHGGWCWYSSMVGVGAGDCNISPAVLAGMWREEEGRSRVLEEKLKQLMANRGVRPLPQFCRSFYWDYISGLKFI